MSEKSSELKLQLFVAGESEISQQAVTNLRKICQTHFPEAYSLEIVDIVEHPSRITSDNIIATPTLVKLSPRPVRRLVGDFSDIQKVLTALGVS